jgi:hypothetical protein
VKEKTNKKKADLPDDCRLVNELPEPLPVFVALKAIDKIVLGTTPKTWSNWMHKGEGPRPYRKNSRIYFKVQDVIDYIQEGD